MIFLRLWPPPKSSHLLFPRHISSSIPQSSSRLRDIYGFTPPPSFSQNPYSDLKAPNSNPKTPKKEKPQYRLPSSIDPATTKKIRTTLPFDFRLDPTVRSVDGKEEIDLEEKRRKMRESVLGEPLSDADAEEKRRKMRETGECLALKINFGSVR
ncbi:hypothetical protein QQ045_002403 [Rhodiola kirilowii]